MKSKEKGWLANLLGWGRQRQAASPERIYASAIEIARKPDLFAKYGVQDDVDGRFDALALVVALVMRRLKGLGTEGQELSQQLFDSMFADMDLSLREMGAGDLGVSKRVRVMAEAFMGRLDAYVGAIDAGDRPALAAALERNLLRGDEAADAEKSGLVDYVFEMVTALDNVDATAMLAGNLEIEMT
jgi:cytochrome b pre-mRNA-processing protein 3